MNYTTWLRWGLLAGVFIIPFILFISPTPGVQVLGNMFFPFITGKNFAFRIIVELMLTCYVILALKEPKYRPTSSLIMWAAIAFVIWMAAATLFSVDPVKSFWSNFERMEGYVGLLHLFGWFIITGAFLSAENLWDRFFNVSIAAAMITGVMAIFQMIQVFGFSPSSQSGARADTTFGNAAYLAVYMLIMLFITLYMLVRRKESVGWQVYYGLALVLEAVGLYATETRGAILGAVGGLIVAALWIALRGRGVQWKGLRRLSIGTLIAVVVIVAGFFALRSTPIVQNSSTLHRLASISLTDSTTISRFQIWNMAWKGFSQSPKTVILGWGQENFNFVFNQYYQPSMWDQEQWFDRAHNQFVDWFINGGIGSGLLYISLYVLAAWAIIKSERLSVPEQGILLGLFAGFAFNNLFVFDNLLSALYFWALMGFVHMLVRRPVPSRLVLTKPMGAHGLAIAAPIVAVVILGFGWWVNEPGIVRAQTLVYAVTPNMPGTMVATYLQDAMGPEGWPPGNQIGRQETAEQTAQYASSQSSSQSPDVAAKINTLAQNALNDILAQRPHDARMELFEATFLASVGQGQAAINELKAALADSPQKQQIFFQLGVTSLNSGDRSGALDAFKRAYDEDPSYPLARILYASGFYYTGQIAQGDALLIQGFGTTTYDNDQLIQVYTDTKQYGRVADIWGQRISSDPTNVNNYLSLAQVYFNAGDKAHTISTLEKIKQISPAQAGQVDQLVQQIQNGTLKPPGQ